VLGTLDPLQWSRALGLISGLVPGQVTTFDRLSEATGLSVRALQHMIDRLTDTERTTVPWHRVVAGGGAVDGMPARPSRGSACWRRASRFRLLGWCRTCRADFSRRVHSLKAEKLKRPRAAGPGDPAPTPRQLSDGGGRSRWPLSHTLASAPPSRHNGATERWASYD
jgi:hypothetical protein